MKGKAGVMYGVIMSVLVALGCKGDSTDPAAAPTVPPNTVVMGAASFSPSTITIQRGTTITWQNNDAAVHTSTSDSVGWDTGNVPSGTTKVTTFNAPGTFHFHCTYHRAMGMVGTVIVQ